jgi:hypothetical protein
MMATMMSATTMMAMMAPMDILAPSLGSPSGVPGAGAGKLPIHA